MHNFNSQETQDILKHYAFIMQSPAIKGVRQNFQKDFTLAQLSLVDDPYLSLINLERFLSTEPCFANVRYQELVWLIDHYEALNMLSKSSKIFTPQFPEKVGKKLVFLLWFQGENSAPPIVKANIRRLKEYFENYEIVFLSDENIVQWMDISNIPNYEIMKEKFPAHLSDVIRSYLLATYGGVWLDSTVVINSDSVTFLEKNMERRRHFILRYSDFRIANWLIATKEQDKTMRLQYVALTEWLKRKKVFLEYFQFHTFFEIFSMLDDDFLDATRLRAPDAFLLSKKWPSVIQASNIQNIFEKMPFQKLNYKIDRNKVLPRTVEHLFENYLDPTSDNSLQDIYKLPNAKNNAGEQFFTENPQKIIAKKEIDIWSGVDFTANTRVGILPPNKETTVLAISGTIAGTPRLKIDSGYITANKKWIQSL